MKQIERFLFIGLFAALMVSCTHNEPVFSGDLIFVEGMSASIRPECCQDTLGIRAECRPSMDQAIMGSTGAMVHVGIIEGCNDSLFVIDAAPKTGVSRRELNEFLEAQRDEEGRMPNIKIMQLKDQRGVMDFVAKAKMLVGAEYDFTFLPDNGKYYCSELVYECYQRNGKPIFEAAPMNFRNADGEFDAFWVELFERQGMEIPQGVLGTNPNDLYHSSLLVPVY